MCGSNGFNDACCPSGQIFQEQLCGNFNNPTNDPVDQIVWTAPPGDYIEGTFEIFNSASSPGDVTGTVTTTGDPVTVGPVPPGNSVASAALNPTQFSINIPAGANGKYCITLYKRVLA